MSVFAAAAKSTEEFAKVKAGLDQTGSVPFEFLGWLVLGLALVIGLSLLVSWLRRRRNGSLTGGWTTIAEPRRLAAVLRRAADRRAECTLEIFGARYADLYRGRAFDADPEIGLVLDLTQAPQGEILDLPVQACLIFRPAPKQAVEQYRFSSRVLALEFSGEKSRRSARVIVAWPKSLISAQRRDFLRVEPAGEYALSAALRPAPEVPPADPEAAPPEAEASVLDISVSGIQLLIPGRPNLPDLPDLPEQPLLLVTLDLPVTGLDVELNTPRLHLLLSPLYRDLVTLPGEIAAPAGRTRTVIRGNFVGRYSFSPETGTWRQVGFNEEAFQDLTRWIYAYQRFQLKKAKGLTPAPPPRFNLYPAVPPERPKGEDEA
jgi:hypothetical protein